MLDLAELGCAVVALFGLLGLLLLLVVVFEVLLGVEILLHFFGIEWGVLILFRANRSHMVV